MAPFFVLGYALHNVSGKGIMLHNATAFFGQEALKKYATHERAIAAQRYFKTAPGEYAHGDIFMGVSVPNVRLVAKDFYDMPLDEVAVLITSPIHEERLLALIILVKKYERAKKDMQEQQRIYDFYCSNTSFINNWDLVDTSAAHIVGAHLYDKDRSVLNMFAASSLLWERRIAIIATHYFIKKNDFKMTIHLAHMLLRDTHDLMHKAVGWMLREMGEREIAPLKVFLEAYAQVMPRTMLRYALEKFPEDERQRYLNKKR